MSATSVAFLALCGGIAILVMMIWAPFRAGRRPLALFDQLAVYGTVGVLSGHAASTQGYGLWLTGSLGLAFGLAGYLASNSLVAKACPTQKAAAVTALLAVLAVCVTTTMLGIYTGQRLMNH